jgi:hypothetical protein
MKDEIRCGIWDWEFQIADYFLVLHFKFCMDELWKIKMSSLKD